jgi:hypothetical protein
MKLFRMFRHKKYGEPLEPPPKIVTADNVNADDIEEMKKQKSKKGPKRRAS